MGFRAPIKVWGVELRVQVWGLGRTEEGDVVVGLGGLVCEKLEPGTGEAVQG